MISRNDAYQGSCVLTPEPAGLGVGIIWAALCGGPARWDSGLDAAGRAAGMPKLMLQTLWISAHISNRMLVLISPFTLAS
jgi:hypothetical protein